MTIREAKHLYQSLDHVKANAVRVRMFELRSIIGEDIDRRLIQAIQDIRSGLKGERFQF